MERPRDRRGRQCEHIGVESEPLKAFLVFDTEAMLLVNDDQSELRERDVGAQKAMSADDDVNLSSLETREHRRLLLRRLKSPKRFHVDRKIGKPLAERPPRR